MKKECEIVRDLIPNYIEKQINNESKKFLENHVASCRECEKILKELNGEIDRKIEISEEEKKEIDFFKKNNKKIFTLKIIVIILTAFIIFNLGIQQVQKIYIDKQGEKIYNIIQQVYNNTQDFKNEKNFKFSVESVLETYDYYYKDGKYKQEIKLPENVLGCNLKYGKLIENDMITINFWDYVKIIDSTVSEDIGIEDKEFRFENAFRYLYDLVDKDIIECGKISVSEEIYNNKECYILKEENNILIIDKKDMLIVSYGRYYENGEKILDINYEYQVGKVLEEDITIKDFKEYEFDEITRKNLNMFKNIDNK